MTTGNGTQPGAATAPADPVIVVGAGPVGLLLAGELRLGGAGVVVVDDRPGPTTESRASTLHARTMEILDSRGLLAELGLPANEPRGHYGGLPLDLTLPSSHPGQWKVSQTRTEELLQRWARALGADVRRGLRVRALAQDATGVSVEAEAADGSVVRLRGCLLVGCDGELSTVRELVGAELAGREAGREMLRADVRGVRIENRRFQRLPGGLAVAATREGVTRVMVHEFGSTVRPRSGPPGFEEVAAAWKRVTGDDISGGTPLWLNSFGDANRQLTRYRYGRVLFAGDAAHQQMPVGARPSTSDSRTPSTWAGSWRSKPAGGRPRGCWTAITGSVTRPGGGCWRTSGPSPTCCSAVRRPSRSGLCAPNCWRSRPYGRTWPRRSPVWTYGTRTEPVSRRCSGGGCLPRCWTPAPERCGHLRSCGPDAGCSSTWGPAPSRRTPVRRPWWRAGRTGSSSPAAGPGPAAPCRRPRPCWFGRTATSPGWGPDPGRPLGGRARRAAPLVRARGPPEGGRRAGPGDLRGDRRAN